MLLAILTLLWGTNWPLFALAVAEVSVWTFRAIAVPASGLAMLLVARMRGMPLAVPRRDWPRLVAAAVTYLVTWNIFTTYAAVMIPSGQSAILSYTMPLWAALLARIFLGEALTPRLLAALALGAGAVGLLMVPGLKAYAQAPAGFALGLAAGLGWAIGTLIIKRHVWSTPVLVLTGWQMLVTAVPIVGGAVVLGDHQWFMPSWQSIVVIAYITFVPMTIGNYCWFLIVGLLPANVAGLSAILVPVVAMISGAIIHREPLGLLQLAAMALCAGSMSLALFKPAAPAGGAR
ncbi:MAG: DMT family transporter [Burkholderiales bacterium]|nr:DMT family transporter [Burkholderiales bacterium]